MVENVILDICNFLKTKHILISTQNQWLRGCISCFKEDNQHFTSNQLKELVFDQWKLADLKDIRAPSLPNNCTTDSKLILPGKYAVQINYVVNIGESFYKQLQKIRRPAAEENLSVDDDKEKFSGEPSAGRTLKLEITDGIVTLLGFEDKPIRKLVEPFVPGVKAVLNGPIECRKGVLFLKNENIDILGGEVDTLHIPNAQENILARALNQPENPDPYKLIVKNEEASQQENILEEDSDAFLLVPDEIETFSLAHTSSLSSHPSSFSNSNSTPNHSKQNNRIKSNVEPITKHTKSVTSSGSSRNVNTLSSNSENNKNMKILPGQKINNPKNNKNVTSVTKYGHSSDVKKCLNSSDIVIDDSDDDVFAMLGDESSVAPEKVNTFKTSSKQSSIQNYFSNNNSSSSSIKNTDKSKPPDIKQDAVASKIEKGRNESFSSTHIEDKIPCEELRAQLEESYSNSIIPQKQKANSIDNVVSSCRTNDKKPTKDLFKEFHVIEEDLACKKNKIADEIISSTFPPKKYPCTLIVQGKVVDIARKLSIQENKWCLSTSVKIKGVEMEVDFSSDVLDSVFGMTAEEMQIKRKEVKKNPELKEQINDNLKSSQRRIQNFDGLMKILFTNYIAKPIILELIY